MIDDGVVYELKAVETLNGQHEAQLLNYLFLTDINYGKLINFRPTSVESKFVSTKLNISQRKNYKIDKDNWDSGNKSCQCLEDIIISLLDDWGAFLSILLYNEAICHFLGGMDKIKKPVEIYYNNRVVGHQNMLLIDNDTAFHLSGLARAQLSYEKNIIRLLKHTKLRQVNWLNFDKTKITLKTIKK